MSIVFSWSTGTWWHFHFVLEYKDMVDVTTTGKNYGYFIKQIENIFCISILWQKHSWHHFNQRNTCKHLAMLCVFWGIFYLKWCHSCFYCSTVILDQSSNCEYCCMICHQGSGHDGQCWAVMPGTLPCHLAFRPKQTLLPGTQKYQICDKKSSSAFFFT